MKSSKKEVERLLLKDKNKLKLRDVILKLYASAKESKYGDRDFLGMVLSFCQEIPYEIVPKTSDGKYILGLFPPTQVLVENRGDCDCKAILFSTIWSIYRDKSVIVIDLPGHVFVAVKSNKCFSTDLGFQLNGETYVCMEPVGPGKLPPGKVGDSSRSHFRAGNYKIR